MLFVLMLVGLVVAVLYLLNTRPLIKTFFMLTLVASVVALPCFMITTLILVAHNHYKFRYNQLHDQNAVAATAGWQGLTRQELSLYPDKVAKAYEASVDDADKMGRANSVLLVQVSVVVVLLFVTSVLGVRATSDSHRRGGRSSTKAAQPIVVDGDEIEGNP